jgi:hypothetical protein
VSLFSNLYSFSVLLSDNQFPRLTKSNSSGFIEGFNFDPTYYLTYNIVILVHNTTSYFLGGSAPLILLSNVIVIFSPRSPFIYFPLRPSNSSSNFTNKFKFLFTDYESY